MPNFSDRPQCAKSSGFDASQRAFQKDNHQTVENISIVAAATLAQAFKVLLIFFVYIDSIPYSHYLFRVHRLQWELHR